MRAGEELGSLWRLYFNDAAVADAWYWVCILVTDLYAFAVDEASARFVVIDLPET